MDPQVKEEFMEKGFRRVHLEVDGASGGGSTSVDPEGTCDVKEAEVEDDGCNVWEYKLHRNNIIDGPSSPIIFSSRSDLHLFLDRNRNCTGNPFGDDKQAIILCPEGATEAENLTIFFDLAKQLGQALGKYIKEMEVKLWGMGNQKEVYRFIVVMLARLPNLKTLHLNLALARGKYDDFDLATIDLHPTCPTLEYLNLRLYNSRHFFMLAPLIDVYGPKLKKISVTPFTWDLLSVNQKKSFKNLKEFNLCWYSNQVMEVETDSMYAPFPEDFAPNLEKLRLLYIDCAKLERPLEWLFYMLQKFPRLNLLNLTGFHLIPDDKVRVRDLPGNANLKSLKFQDHADMNYDFLVKLTGLQNLFIEGNRFTYSYENEEDTFEAEEGAIKLRCFLYRKRLSESNVWEKVPSLKKIVLERYARPGKVPPEAEEYLKPE